VVALWDYLNASFRKSVEKLEHAYWPQVLKIAPALSPGERAELFFIVGNSWPHRDLSFISQCADQTQSCPDGVRPAETLTITVMAAL
jgi:hypothetical protein